MARVIKAGGSSARIVPGVVIDARTQAQQLLAAARAEVAALRHAAHAQGHAEGRAEGRAELAQALLEQQHAHARALDALQAQALEVALIAAKRIVGDALALEPEKIAGVVLPLLERLRRARRVVLRVHPDDRGALESALAAWRAPHDTQVAVGIEVDPAISRGGCVAQSEIGALDARVETQLDALARALQQSTR